jgi:hypothetical protein
MTPDYVKDFIELFPGNQVFCAISQSQFVEHLPGNIEENYNALLDMNQKGWSIYFTVNESTNGRRRKSDIQTMRAVFIDDDTPKDNPLTGFSIEPTCVVETSPGKFHYYWCTSTRNKQEWIGVQKRLIQAFHTDPAIKDESRVMRLPGFINSKYTDQFCARIVSKSNKVYEWDEITSVFPPIYEMPTDTGRDPGQSGDFNFVKLIKAFQSGESITPSMNSLIMHWVYRYTESKVETLVNQMFSEVDPQIYEGNRSRYEYAKTQIQKFIRTAKIRCKDKDISAIFEEEKDTRVYPTPDPLGASISFVDNDRCVPLDTNSVPDVLLNAASEVGDWAAVGREPAVFSGMVVISTLLGKNVLIHVSDDLTTHCQMGILMAMDTGMRKTSVYEKMNEPFFAYEDKLIHEWTDQRYQNSAEITILNKLIEKKQKDMMRSKDVTFDEISAGATEIATLKKKIDEIQRPRPSLYSNDITEERLIRALAHNNAALGIISDDARNVINNILGRYLDGGTSEGIYIAGLTGGDYKYERVGLEEPIFLKRICMNVLLFVQPDSALRILESAMYIPSGLAARLPIFFYRTDPVEILENTKSRPLELASMEPYYRALMRLCRRDHVTDPSKGPYHIRMSTQGQARWEAFNKHLADLLRNKWSDCYPIINKINTQSVIYATVFAAIEDPLFYSSTQEGESWEYTLGVKHINMGQQFALSLFSQCIQAHSTLVDDRVLKAAKITLRAIASKYEQEDEMKATYLEAKADGNQDVMDSIKDKFNSFKILGGFVLNKAFLNNVPPAYREMALMQDVIELMVQKGWLVTSKTNQVDKRARPGELNTGIMYEYNAIGADKFKRVYGIKNIMHHVENDVRGDFQGFVPPDVRRSRANQAAREDYKREVDQNKKNKEILSLLD